MTMYDLCLLHAHSDRLFRASIASHLEKSHITMMEWLLLGVVQAGGQKGVTMSDIATELQVTLPQVTALVNKLLPLKLIRQKSAASDRRSRLVQLTNKGQLVFDEASAMLDDARAQLLGGASDEDVDTYIKVLHGLSSKSA